MVSGGLQLPLPYPPLLGLGLHRVVLVPCWGVLVLVLGGVTPTPWYLLVWAVCVQLQVLLMSLQSRSAQALPSLWGQRSHCWA